MSAKTILVTGGHGFIGSNMIRYYLNKYPDYQLINIDYNTVAAHPENIDCPEQSARYAFHRVDIRNAYAINHIFEQYDITDVLHFAAETRDANRVGEIRLYEQTNVLGLENLLQAAQNAWMENGHQPKAKYAASRFHHISLAHNENNNLYSISKANADELIERFHEKTGLNIVTTASPEAFGPMQQEDEMIPRMILNALNNESLLSTKASDKTRDWLFIADLCEAIDTVFHLGDAGQFYETGFNIRVTDNALADQIQAMFEDNFPGNKTSLRDKLLHSKAAFISQPQVLGFAPFTLFENGLRTTLDWYLKKYKQASFLTNS